MAPKGISSKDTIGRSTREIVESTTIYLPVYSDTQLFVEKESNITWQKVNEFFSTRTFKADLEDWQLYVNV